MSNYKYYEIPVCHMANGMELKLPVHEISGGDGPVIGMTACIHGDETISVEIARNLVERLKEEELHGTVKIMSVASPLAFEAANRNTPVDQVNMNRIFPGRYEGTITEIQARVIADKFLEGIDAYIDIHAGGQDPVVEYAYVINDEMFSRAFLSKVVYRPVQDYEGTSATYTKPKNIPTVTVECGGGPNEQHYVERGVSGILNMLRQKQVLDGEVKTREDQICISHIEHVNPHHGGLFVPALTYEVMNTIVEGKVVLGRVYNPMTLELLEEIKAPYDKNFIILMRGNINRIIPGDFTFMIGDLDSEVTD